MRIRIVVIDQRRTNVAFSQLAGRQNVLVTYLAQQFVLACGDILALAPLCFWRFLRIGENPHAFAIAFDARVLRFPILVAIVLADQVDELVVADRRRPGALAQTQLLHRSRKCALGRAVDRRESPDALRRAAFDHAQDAGASCTVGIGTQMDVLRGNLIETQPAQRRGEKDHGLYVGHRKVLERRLACEQRFQLFRLAIGEQERIIFVALTASGCRDGPRVLVAGDGTGPVLDLDQIHAIGRSDQCIDLVDTAVFGNKLEVRPRAEWRGIGQASTQKLQRFLLMRER